MNRLSLWCALSGYFREGVILPTKGDYIVPLSDGSFRADIIGGLILSKMGPRNFNWENLHQAIEPGVVSEFMEVYSGREVALIEAAYEGRVFGWSRDYLSEADMGMLNDWLAAGLAGNLVPPVMDVRNRFMFFVDKMINVGGEVGVFLRV